MKWFRMYAEIIDDTKIAGLSDRNFRLFNYLLCLASDADQNGLIPMTKDEIIWRLRITNKDLSGAVDQLSKANILNKSFPLRFLNWEKRQYKSDDITARTKRSKEKTRNVPGNVERNVPGNVERNVPGNVPEDKKGTFTGTFTGTAPDTDTDTDTEANNSLTTSSGPPSSNGEITVRNPLSNDPKKDAPLKTKTIGDNDQEKADLKDLAHKVLVKYPRFNLSTFIGNHSRDNPRSILHTLRSLLKANGSVDNPMAYCEATIKIENGKYNARDHEDYSKQFKEPVNLGKILKGLV